MFLKIGLFLKLLSYMRNHVAVVKSVDIIEPY
jgi:hypothetical protein